MLVLTLKLQLHMHIGNKEEYTQSDRIGTWWEGIRQLTETVRRRQIDLA
jgi:hypothetical protein